MTDASSALAALALAVRERLLVGGAATLPGLGTLARAHVPARVQTRPDGQRVLLPPGETVTLSAAAGDATTLAALVVRHQGTPQADPIPALRTALDQLEARLAATGEAHLPGVGAFQRTSSGVRFAAAPDLLGAVNRPFVSLPPVRAMAADGGTVLPPAPVEPSTPPTDEPLTTPLDWPGDAPGVPVLNVSEPPPDVPVAESDWASGLDVPSDRMQAPPLADDLAVADVSPERTPPEREDAADDDLDLELERLVGESLGTLDPPAASPPTRPDPTSEDDVPARRDPSEWMAASARPAPDPLGAPDPIEDAEFSVLGALVSDALSFPEAAADEPGAAPGSDAGAPVAPEAAPAPPPALPSDRLPADRGRSRWQAVMGWLLIAAALGALSVLWILARADARRDAATPSVAPALAPPLPAPAARPDTAVTDSAAVGPAGDTLSAAPGGASSAPLTVQAPGAPDPSRSSTVSPARVPSDAARTDGARALGRAPERGQAILPPRLAGLDTDDAQALAGRAPVDATLGGYTWVVLSTPSDDDANALAARYRVSGYRTGVVEGGGTRRWRVAVGHFDSREQALRLRDRLPPQAPPDTWPLSLR